EIASASPRPARPPMTVRAAMEIASATPPAWTTSTLAMPMSCILRYAVRTAATLTAVVPISMPNQVLMMTCSHSHSHSHSHLGLRPKPRLVRFALSVFGSWGCAPNPLFVLQFSFSFLFSQRSLDTVVNDLSARAWLHRG